MENATILTPPSTSLSAILLGQNTTITSGIAAKQTVINEVYVLLLFCFVLFFNEIVLKNTRISPFLIELFG